MKKKKVAVLFGGVSSEHEVSLRSAASVIAHLDQSRFDIVPIGIDKQGAWLLHDVAHLKYSENNALILQHVSAPLQLTTQLIQSGLFDAVFPVVHGTLCEDGCLQGLLESLDIPYVGSGVLGSAVAMDKVISKQLAKAAGFPVAPFQEVRLSDWLSNQAAILNRIALAFEFPCFVKPASNGSSVGIHKVKRAEDLKPAIIDALRYDTKILVEKGIVGREIEVSVLEELDPAQSPRASLPGEIKPRHEFYTYQAKYLDPKGAELFIPAALSPKIVERIRKVASDIFKVLNCEGMARVDFFVEEGTHKIIFSEANTLPGFTSISMYPQLWQVSGLSYSHLLTHLIELALQRHAQRKQLHRECEYLFTQHQH